MKGAFKDRRWRWVWIDEDESHPVWCENCFHEAEHCAKAWHPKLKGEDLEEKVFEVLYEEFDSGKFGELWCNGSRILFVGYCDQCGNRFIDFGREGMLDYLLNDFYLYEEDNYFNYSEFLKRYFRQKKETKEYEKKTPKIERDRIKAIYDMHDYRGIPSGEMGPCCFQSLAKHVKTKWDYVIKYKNIPTIKSLHKEYPY